MNILLWVIQVFVAFFCAFGAGWRLGNREAMMKMPSFKALSLGMYYALSIYEIACSLGLILPGLLNMDPTYTPIAAFCLAVEQLVLTVVHMKFFGFKMKATNPGVWTLTFFVLSAFIAYGRIMLMPF